MWSRAQTIRALVTANVGSAAAATIIYWLFNPRAGWRSLLLSCAIGLLYSTAIGTPSILLLPIAGRRVWNRPFVVRWGILLGLMASFAFLGSLLVATLLHAVGVYPRLWQGFAGGFRLAIILTLAFGIGGTIMGVLRSRLEQSELERERALKLASVARLSSLESRVHPHFLFNTLNSISSLIREDPARAERMIEQVAAVLRYSLDANPAQLVPLERELKIVGDYLEIERARFGERLRYSIDVPAALVKHPVPSFALQTLVENSVKHVVARRREGASIQISAQTDNGRLRLTVADDGPGFDGAALPPGHGLDNLRARLATLYGAGDAKLEVARSNVSILTPLT